MVGDATQRYTGNQYHYTWMDSVTHKGKENCDNQCVAIAKSNSCAPYFDSSLYGYFLQKPTHNAEKRELSAILKVQYF